MISNYIHTHTHIDMYNNNKKKTLIITNKFIDNRSVINESPCTYMMPTHDIV